ncbi:unnamed protein product [Brassica rapa subsp. narinosa]
MVRDRNAEHVLAEKGSSSHPKRQPLSSLVEDEAEPVQEAEGGENGEEGTVRLLRSPKKKKKTCLHCCALFQDSLKSQAGVFIQNTVTLLEKAWQNTEKDNLKLFFRKAQECATDFYSREEILDRLAKEFGEEATKKTHELFFSSKTGQLAYGLLDCPVCCHALTRPVFQVSVLVTFFHRYHVFFGKITLTTLVMIRTLSVAFFVISGDVNRIKGILFYYRTSFFFFFFFLLENITTTVQLPSIFISWKSHNVLTALCHTPLFFFFFYELPLWIYISLLLFSLWLFLQSQCDNGHIACSSCCTNLRSKCPSCTLPIGVYRNRMMERVVEAVIVPCPNAKHGCTEMFSYGKELVHEKECSFALCYCPRRGCNYAGLCKDLYRHYYNCSSAREYFRCGYNVQAWMHIRDKILVLQEGREGPLVAIQCFEEEQGVYVTVNCIAPCVPGVSEFSFQLSYSSYGGADKTMSFGLGEMNRIQKVCFQTPDKDFMFVPHYFLAGRTSLKMNICVRRRGGEEEEENT